MRAASIISLLPCLAFIPSASAWIYSWHTPSDKLLSYQDEKPLDCRAMNNPAGNVFNWEPQDGHWCIFMYTNSKCENEFIGHTCKDWEWANHNSSEHILSFKVTNNTVAFSSTAASPASTTETTSTTSQSSTAASTPSEAIATVTSGAENSSTTSSSSSPSGGAIAGIVVGVLAALAIAGLLFFFLCWRRRKSDGRTNDRSESATGMVELSNSHHGEESLKSPVQAGEKVWSQPQAPLRELNGSTVASEIGSGTERYEMYSPVSPQVKTERLKL